MAISPAREKFLAEREGIAETLRAVLEAFLEDRGIPAYNDVLDEVLGRHAIGEFPEDRAMHFFVDDLNAFTPEFVRVLQEHVLAEYRRWRLVAQFNERKIDVYPRRALLDGAQIHGRFDDDHPVYSAWLRKSRRFDEKRFGPLRRQLAVIRQRIPVAMAAAKKNQFAFLAAFDTYPPHDPTLAIWVLQTLGEYELRMKTGISPIRCSAVGKTGKIYPQYGPVAWPRSGRKPPFWLVTYLSDAVKRRKFTMSDKNDKTVGEVTVSEILRDKELRETIGRATIEQTKVYLAR